MRYTLISVKLKSAVKIKMYSEKYTEIYTVKDGH